MSRDIVNVRMERVVWEMMAFRTDEGYRVTVDWGEPDEEGFHNPTFTMHSDDRLIDLREDWHRRALGDAISNLIFDGLTR
jgi:hypothetical protein